MSVLKEEKRNLLRQVDELSKTRQYDDSVLHRHRSQSFSEQRDSQRNLRNTATPTRDMGTMCGVMTRDVGVSHQQVRRRLPFHAVLSAPSISFCSRSLMFHRLRNRNTLRTRRRINFNRPRWKICIYPMLGYLLIALAAK